MNEAIAAIQGFNDLVNTILADPDPIAAVGTLVVGGLSLRKKPSGERAVTIVESLPVASRIVRNAGGFLRQLGEILNQSCELVAGVFDEVYQAAKARGAAAAASPAPAEASSAPEKPAAAG